MALTAGNRLALVFPVWANLALAASPCANALAQVAVCGAANTHIIGYMRSRKLTAAAVVQNVSTGAVVAIAASEPEKMDVTTHVLPLSLTKILLAASWWDNNRPDIAFESTRGEPQATNPAFRSRVSAYETLVGGSDSVGREIALALRMFLGTDRVVSDFARLGFGPGTAARVDERFWAEVEPAWRRRLTPPPAYLELRPDTSDEDWAISSRLVS